ncbi:MAG: TetR/AcrR family transcriptional regulator C-terminal domain-containing protein [Firmicutes bacterium]|nr:TetR/AcrR family transcriptional regulator C-terminal domain-containing protein [Bacillota bacterium]
MKSEKTDRRVKYTKMVLKKSLIELLKKKHISKISIKEICELADINRATFYAHYTDQYDLRLNIENELIEEINNYLNSYPFSNPENISLDMLVKIFEYLKENAEVCIVLLGDTGDINFQKKVMKIVRQQCISAWTSLKEINEEDAEFMYTFYAIGSVGIIQKWLVEDIDKSPIEMATLILKLANNGLSGF